MLHLIDIFGKPLEVNLRGKGKIYSSVGGFMTIIYLLIFLPYAVIKGIKLVNRTDPEVTYNEVFHDIDGMGTLNADDIYFNLGYSFISPNSQDGALIDETVIMPYATAYEFNVKDSIMTLRKNQDVPIVDCATKFQTVTKGDRYLLYEPNTKCLDLESIKFTGSSTSATTTGLHFGLKRCDQLNLPAGKVCKDQDEVSKLLSNT